MGREEGLQTDNLEQINNKQYGFKKNNSRNYPFRQ